MQENGESDDQKEDDNSSLLDELEDEEETHPTESKKESSAKRVDEKPEPKKESKEEDEENYWYDEYEDKDNNGFLDEIDDMPNEIAPKSETEEHPEGFKEEDNTDTIVVTFDEEAFKDEKEDEDYCEDEQTGEYKFAPKYEVYNEFAKKGVVALNNKNAQQLIEMIGRLAMIEQTSQDRMEALEDSIRKKERHKPLKYGLIAFLFYVIGMVFTYYVIH